MWQVCIVIWGHTDAGVGPADACHQWQQIVDQVLTVSWVPLLLQHKQVVLQLASQMMAQQQSAQSMPALYAGYPGMQPGAMTLPAMQAVGIIQPGLGMTQPGMGYMQMGGTAAMLPVGSAPMVLMGQNPLFAPMQAQSVQAQQMQQSPAF